MKHPPGPVAPERLIDDGGVALAVPAVAVAPTGGGEVGEGVAARKLETELPDIVSLLSPTQVIERLGRESKRGRLAGFRVIEPAPPGLPSKSMAAVTAFGGVYDYDLLMRVTARGEGGSDVGFEMRLLRKMPIIAVLVIVVSIFPGLQVTHSMLSLYFSWYTIETWWWYMPLLALSLPFMWKQFTTSRAEARRDAAVTIGKIGALLATK